MQKINHLMLLAAGVLSCCGSAFATPPSIAMHTVPAITAMNASPQMIQVTSQLAQQQAKIEQLEARLDTLTAAGKGVKTPVPAGKTMMPPFKTLPHPVLQRITDNQLATKAAGMRVLSTKLSSAANASDKPKKIVVLQSAGKIQPLLAASAGGGNSHTDMLTTAEQVKRLTATVNQLDKALILDEQTIDQLSGAQFAWHLRVMNDEINAVNFADNVSSFESTTTTTLGNHLNALYGLWSGVVDSYTLACQVTNPVNYLLAKDGTNTSYPMQSLDMNGWFTTLSYPCQ